MDVRPLIKRREPFYGLLLVVNVDSTMTVIRSNFDRGVARWRSSQVLKPLLDDYPVAGSLEPRPFLAEVGAADFIADHELHEEIFGSAAPVVRTATTDDAVKVLQAVGGSLTTLWGADVDIPDSRRIVHAASQVSGRVLFSGVPTGVAVTAAQHHGGPYPLPSRLRRR